MPLETLLAENTAAQLKVAEMLARLIATLPTATPVAPPAETVTVTANEPAPAPEVAAAEPPKPRRQPKLAAVPTEAPAPSAPTAEAAVAAAPEPKPEPASAVTYDDVKRVLIAMTTSRGRNAVVDLLARYGVQRAPDLKPEVYAELIAEAQAA